MRTTWRKSALQSSQNKCFAQLRCKKDPHRLGRKGAQYRAGREVDLHRARKERPLHTPDRSVHSTERERALHSAWEEGIYTLHGGRRLSTDQGEKVLCTA